MHNHASSGAIGVGRVVRGSGCSGPRTLSYTGSSAANWSRAPAASPASPGGPLVQLALDPPAQPLDQAFVIAELRRAHLAGDLIPERQHERCLGRIGDIGQADVGDARAQQRDPRDAALASPPELQMSDRQPPGIVLGRHEPIPVPHDQHIQVTRADIVQAAIPHGVAVG